MYHSGAVSSLCPVRRHALIGCLVLGIRRCYMVPRIHVEGGYVSGLWEPFGMVSSMSVWTDDYAPPSLRSPPGPPTGLKRRHSESTILSGSTNRKSRKPKPQRPSNPKPVTLSSGSFWIICSVPTVSLNICRSYKTIRACLSVANTLTLVPKPKAFRSY